MNRISPSTDSRLRVGRNCLFTTFALVLMGLLVGPTAPIANAQQQDEDPLLNIGIPPLSLTIPVPSGVINAGNGQLTINIPLASLPQRAGGPLAMRIQVQGVTWTQINSAWGASGIAGTLNTIPLQSTPAFGGGGWGGGDKLGTICNLDGVEEWDTFGGFVYVDGNGTTHPFPVTTTLDNTTSACRYTHTDVPNADGLALDGSGYHLYVQDYNTVTAIYAPDGTLVSGNTRKDSNGNEITWQETYPQNVDTFYPSPDTAGRTPVTVSANGNTTTLAVLNSKGGTSSYSYTVTTITVKSDFKAMTSNTGSDSTMNVLVIQSVSLPDGTSYSFKYDCDSTTGNTACGSPGGQSAYYGDIISVSLPTTGTVTYSYQNFEDAEGSYFNGGYSYTHITRLIKSMTTPDGTWQFNPSVITYGINAGKQEFQAVKPDSSKINYMYSIDGGVFPYETDYYDQAGNLDVSLTATYDFSNSCSTIMSGEGICLTGSATYVNRLTETTTLPVPGGTVSTTTGFTWDPAHTGNITQKSEWNFGSSTSGNADRTTAYAYLVSPNTNMVDRVASATIKNSAGAIVAQTINCYDGSTTSPCNYASTPASATGKTQHDDAGFPTTYTYRGNLTQVLKLISGTTNYLSTSRTVYDMTGQVVSQLDSNGNQTSYDYTDNFFDDTGDSANPPSTHSLSQATNAYLKKITYPPVNGVTLTNTFGYYWGSGKKALSTDPNSQTTYFHFYDPYNLDRPTSTHLPNNGWTFTQYSASERQVDSGIGITSTTESASCTGTSGGCRHDETQLDTSGRMQYQILVSDPEGADTVYTTYDSNGRVKTVSNPYRSSSSPTDGTETYAYDGLNRKVQVTRADGGNEYTYYGGLVTAHGGVAQQCATTFGYGYPELTNDEAGNKRETWTDGFGRLIEVDEPSVSGSLSSGAKTCYAYDLNNNLIGVLQPGGSESTCVATNGTTYNRCFSYDMMSRLTAATNPETTASTNTGSGTINYYYTTTTSGTTPCSGDPSAVCLRVAPLENQTSPSNTVQTAYAYDALNRIAGKFYTDSTWPIYYYYDQTGRQNSNGRLSSEYTYNAGVWLPEHWFDYDPVGNVVTDTQWASWVANIYNYIYYTYNLDSSIASLTYPSGRKVTYTTSNAQRTTTASDSSNNYALGPTACPFNENNSMNWACYTPPGELDALKNGSSLTTTAFYNNRLQPCRTAVNTTGNTPPANCSDSHVGDKFDLQYFFDLSSMNQVCGTNYGSSTDNGNLAYIQNNVQSMSGRSQEFCYDALNRIASARTTSVYSTGPQYCWGETYGIDPLGNLTSIAQMTPTYNSCVQESGFSNPVNSHNQDSASCYDAAGNKVGAPPCSPNLPTTFFHDAENRICAFGGTSCATGTVYTYDAGGKRVEKSSGTLYWYRLNGEILAETTLTGSDLNEYVFFGGKRIARVDSSGHVFYYFADHLGTSRVIVQDGATPTLCYDADLYPYGGERTPYTNSCPQNYKFTGKERDSESNLDNFGMRYDSSQYGRFMTPDAFFKDSHAVDPQSWNEYAYARNNPLRYIDPTGENATVSGSCSSAGDGNPTTCNVTISASIAIYAAAGSGLTQDQLNAAASTIQSTIQNAWTGSFTTNGVTYNVTTQISVTVAGSQDAAMNSGAQNVIGLSNGSAIPGKADSVTYTKSLRSALSGGVLGGPDTGVWNINSLSDVAGHEFTHLLGVGDRDSGDVLSNTNILNDPSVPHHATSSDLRWGIREFTWYVNGLLGCGECSIPQGEDIKTTVGAPFNWWK